ncbi:integral membrane protein [Ligilactobacillus hayakitensis DSM 18933 = JCM 14209]|uniref:Integral membrane protein n=1 Tax=Ligilactobacillus hayakitensis DSM 18933 = JCM 14209 TaxID=1423755 RepID=A0A0R1WQ75_9LACO|nr:hypothetical protein [Ligilactobacillus hayakitensis]KRM17897.1 integral membrane protein [Ligilactobacillus hayakitensis DSM 18933 = JCM 14209]
MKKKNMSLDFILMSIFEVLMVVSLILGIIKQESGLYLLENIAGMILLAMPMIVVWLFRVEFPRVLSIVYMLFIIGSVYLGTLYHFYSVAYWDKGLHVLSGILLAGFGWSLYGILVPKYARKYMSPGFIAFYAFAFAMMCGVFWEFYEFSMDGLFGMNLQRFISTTGHALVGRAALMDTMGDLFADAIGALLLSIVGYFQILSKPKWIENFYFDRASSMFR